MRISQAVGELGEEEEGVRSDYLDQGISESDAANEGS